MNIITTGALLKPIKFHCQNFTPLLNQLSTIVFFGLII